MYTIHGCYGCVCVFLLAGCGVMGWDGFFGEFVVKPKFWLVENRQIDLEKWLWLRFLGILVSWGICPVIVYRNPFKTNSIHASKSFALSWWFDQDKLGPWLLRVYTLRNHLFFLKLPHQPLKHTYYIWDAHGDLFTAQIASWEIELPNFIIRG